jgi:hypothetical protein
MALVSFTACAFPSPVSFVLASNQAVLSAIVTRISLNAARFLCFPLARHLLYSLWGFESGDRAHHRRLFCFIFI